MGLNAGITLSGYSSATVSYNLSPYIVRAPALEKLYKQHRDAFTPDAAKLIDAAFNAADKQIVGPVISLMMTCLHSPDTGKILSNKGRDFLLTLASTDTLMTRVELHGQFTVKSSGSRIPRTYYPCTKVFKIDFNNFGTVAKIDFNTSSAVTKTLTGFNSLDLFTCSKIGSQDKEHAPSSIVV